MLPQLLLHSLAKAEGFDKTAFEAVHNSADAVKTIAEDQQYILLKIVKRIRPKKQSAFFKITLFCCCN